MQFPDDAHEVRHRTRLKMTILALGKAKKMPARGGGLAGTINRTKHLACPRSACGRRIHPDVSSVRCEPLK